HADVAGGALRDRGRHVPHERALPLRRHPGLEPVRRQHPAESGGLREHAEPDRLRGAVLLEHGAVSDPERLGHGPHARTAAELAWMVMFPIPVPDGAPGWLPLVFAAMAVTG